MSRTQRRIDLLIAGASARAAAFSAARANLNVAVADLFADRDAARVADATVISHWPSDIEAWAAEFSPDVPLMYLGGLENEPELLDRIAERRPLFGISGAALEEVRTPERLRERLSRHGIRMPRIAAPPVTNDARWLVKRRHSGGGRFIRFWSEHAAVGPGEYLQEFVQGVPGAAAFLCHCDGTVELLGVTESLIPDSARLPSQPPFAYIGSITAEATEVEPLTRIGACLAEAGLRGVFGVDFIRIRPANAPAFVVLEVNPRYTAGMEALELRSGRSFVPDHCRSFAQSAVASHETNQGRELRDYVGKRIVFAPRTLIVGELPLPSDEEIVSGEYELADIPAAGTKIPAGAPICTVLAHAPSVEDCRAVLKQRERDVLSRCRHAD